MKTLRTLKISPNAPDINSVWLYKGTAKYFNNGKWETIGGESKPCVLPHATPFRLGGVRMASTVYGLNSFESELSKVVEKVNELLAALKAAGIMELDVA